SSAQRDGQLVCFSLRGLPERLKAPALLLCLDAIWHSLEGPLRKRCVLVDEAWLLMREPAGATFLHRLAKSARKRWCGLTTVTQDAGDLLASELGQSVIANTATQVLLRQAPQAIDRIGDAFHLSAGERRYLLSCPTGSGLLLLAPDNGGINLTTPSQTAVADIPPTYLLLYQEAGLGFDVPWEVLAGIGKVECDQGRNPEPACWKEGAENAARAGGLMQFLATTW